jgi:hypothetical protein
VRKGNGEVLKAQKRDFDFQNGGSFCVSYECTYELAFTSTSHQLPQTTSSTEPPVLYYYILQVAPPFLQVLFGLVDVDTFSKQ